MAYCTSQYRKQSSFQKSYETIFLRAISTGLNKGPLENPVFSNAGIDSQTLSTVQGRYQPHLRRTQEDTLTQYLEHNTESSSYRLPCNCQTFKGAISLVLSTRCFLSSFSSSVKSGYNCLKGYEGKTTSVVSYKQVFKETNTWNMLLTYMGNSDI